MIRDPHRVETVGPSYRDFYPTRKKGIGTGTLAAVIIGAVLVVAVAVCAFNGPRQTTTNTNPPPATTGTR